MDNCRKVVYSSLFGLINTFVLVNIDILLKRDTRCFNFKQIIFFALVKKSILPYRNEAFYHHFFKRNSSFFWSLSNECKQKVLYIPQKVGHVLSCIKKTINIYKIRGLLPGIGCQRINAPVFKVCII